MTAAAARAATVRPMSSLWRVVRGMSPRLADVLLATAAVVAFAIEVAVFSEGSARSYVVGGLAAASMAVLAIRRSRPFATALVAAGAGVLAAIASPDVFTNSSTVFIATMIALYSLGRYGEALAPAILVIVLLGVGTLATDSLEAPQQILWLGVLTGGPMAIGRATRSRTALQARLRESTAVLERDRTRRAASAVEDERARLAGELQAVIANGVSAIVVQAEAVPRVLAADERAAAELALTRIETTGRETLAETRRLLGILRRDGDDRALAPQPTLAELSGLAEQMRGKGLAVDLQVEGERGELAAGPDLAAYRVVQQALAEAVAVGAREARILVRYRPDELRVEVRDDRAEASIDPDRLLAMRERLGLYGGRVRAGRDEDGRGFALIARLPATGVAA